MRILGSVERCHYFLNSLLMLSNQVFPAPSISKAQLLRESPEHLFEHMDCLDPLGYSLHEILIEHMLSLPI